MTTRNIVAMGGGGLAQEYAGLDDYVLDLADSDRPRVCFIPTASGDSDTYIARFYEAMADRATDPRVLRLFDRTVDDIPAYLTGMDVIYVGGGNTVGMLAVWRAHGVDLALRSAWEQGVVLCGSSAGANCWFEASTTDSYRLGRADPLRDGLGFLPGSFCPHYRSEPARRSVYITAVAAGELPPGYACDDGAAVHFCGSGPGSAVATAPGAAVSRVTVAGEAPVPCRIV